MPPESPNPSINLDHKTTPHAGSERSATPRSAGPDPGSRIPHVILVSLSFRLSACRVKPPGTFHFPDHFLRIPNDPGPRGAGADGIILFGTDAGRIACAGAADTPTIGAPPTTAAGRTGAPGPATPPGPNDL